MIYILKFIFVILITAIYFLVFLGIVVVPFFDSLEKKYIWLKSISTRKAFLIASFIFIFHVNFNLIFTIVNEDISVNQWAVTYLPTTAIYSVIVFAISKIVFHIREG